MKGGGEDGGVRGGAGGDGLLRGSRLGFLK